MLAPEHHALSELLEGNQATVQFSIGAEQMEAFAELSGDYNPLHTDDTFARHRGYEGRVVYGALLIAKISQLIGMRLPGRNSTWASISFDFRRPLYVDQPAEVEGTVKTVHEATRMILLDLQLRSNGKVLGKGKAEVVIGT